MKIFIIVLIPIISALIGWFTNYIAVKMLFHPRKPKKVLGFIVQGVFPKRQKQIAGKLGALVANELLKTKDLFEKIDTEDTFESAFKNLELKIDKYFDESLPEKYPIVSKLIPASAKNKVKTEILDEIQKVGPGFIKMQIKKVESKINIEAIVEQKVNQLSSEKLEEVIMKVLDSEFKFIELIGAVLGFIIGLVQVFLSLVVL